MRALYNSALRFTQGGDDASDLVQEAYLRAYRTFDNFVPGTNCRAWLLTILYSVFVNQYRKARRAPTISIDALEARFEVYLESPHQTSDAAVTVDVRGTRMNPEVESALRQLPQDFQDAVLLVDVDGLSGDEAAAALQCPVATVRTRVYRGRRLLLAALRDYAAPLGFRRDET